jgi:hypothetical protein
LATGAGAAAARRRPHRPLPAPALSARSEQRVLYSHM